MTPSKCTIEHNTEYISGSRRQLTLDTPTLAPTPAHRTRVMARLAVQPTSEPSEDMARMSAMPTCLTAHVCGVDGVYTTSTLSAPHLWLYKVVASDWRVRFPLTGYYRVEVLVSVIQPDLPFRLNQL